MGPGAAGRAFVGLRLVVGAAFAAAPAFAARTWLGAVAGAPPAASVPLRAMGARDVALSVGALAALRGGAGARPWLRAAALAEAADAVAVLAVARHLPPAQRVVAPAGAALLATAALVLSRRAPG